LGSRESEAVRASRESGPSERAARAREPVERAVGEQ
jgi:hypothetical protein